MSNIDILTGPGQKVENVEEKTPPPKWIFSTSGVDSETHQKWIRLDKIHFQVAELEKRWIPKNWPQKFSKILKVPKVDFSTLAPKFSQNSGLVDLRAKN